MFKFINGITFVTFFCTQSKIGMTSSQKYMLFSYYIQKSFMIFIFYGNIVFFKKKNLHEKCIQMSYINILIMIF